MTMYIGLDVHSKNTVYFALDSDGKKIAKGTVDTTAEGFTRMLDQLKAPEGTAIALESGTLATWASRLLCSLGMSPKVVDAAEVRSLARRHGQKSDYRDAWELADGIRRDLYRRIVFIPDDRIEKLRRVLSRRRHFVARRTSDINAARFTLRREGYSRIRFCLTGRRGWLAMLSHPDLLHLHSHLQMHYGAWLSDSSIIEALELELEELIEPFDRELKLLTSIPGIGLITAGAMIAAVADPRRFPDSSKVASYVGIVPRTYDSASRKIRGHITKAGPSFLRGVLCEAAHQARRLSHPLNPYWRKVCARGGYRKAVVAVAHRLLRIMFAMWRDGRNFDVNIPAIEPDEERSKPGRIVYKLRKSA